MTLFRGISPDELPLLDDFLYEAIFIPDGVPAPPRSIIEQEDLQVSLSVQKANYAFRMYRKAGFETLKETEEEFLMRCRL